MARTQKSLDANLKKLTTKGNNTSRRKKWENDPYNPEVISTHPDAPKCPPSRKLELFPHGNTFKIRFDDKRKKDPLPVSWFRYYYDACAHIEKHNLKPQHYSLKIRSNKCH